MEKSGDGGSESAPTLCAAGCGFFGRVALNSRSAEPFAYPTDDAMRAGPPRTRYAAHQLRFYPSDRALRLSITGTPPRCHFAASATSRRSTRLPRSRRPVPRSPMTQFQRRVTVGERARGDVRGDRPKRTCEGRNLGRGGTLAAQPRPSFRRAPQSMTIKTPNFTSLGLFLRENHVVEIGRPSFVRRSARHHRPARRACDLLPRARVVRGALG